MDSLPDINKPEGSCTSLDTLERRIAFFFDPPKKDRTKHRTPEGCESVLYHLRREMQFCFFNKIVDESAIQAKDEAPWQSIFSGVLLIMCGIDLLGKFLEGDDSTGWGEVGKRFRKYLEDCFDGLSKDQTDLIYTVRNGLVHSFGLYDKDRQKRIVIAPLSPTGEIVSIRDKRYFLHYKNLYVQFVGSLWKYRGRLEKNAELRKNFDKMFAHYAYIVSTESL